MYGESIHVINTKSLKEATRFCFYKGKRSEMMLPGQVVSVDETEEYASLFHTDEPCIVLEDSPPSLQVIFSAADVSHLLDAIWSELCLACIEVRYSMQQLMFETCYFSVPVFLELARW